jgi:hypothetical protein
MKKQLLFGMIAAALLSLVKSEDADAKRTTYRGEAVLVETGTPNEYDLYCYVTDDVCAKVNWRTGDVRINHGGLWQHGHLSSTNAIPADAGEDFDEEVEMPAGDFLSVVIDE